MVCCVECWAPKLFFRALSRGIERDPPPVVLQENQRCAWMRTGALLMSIAPLKFIMDNVLGIFCINRTLCVEFWDTIALFRALPTRDTKGSTTYLRFGNLKKKKRKKKRVTIFHQFFFFLIFNFFFINFFLLRALFFFFFFSLVHPKPKYRNKVLKKKKNPSQDNYNQRRRRKKNPWDIKKKDTRERE